MSDAARQRLLERLLRHRVVRVALVLAIAFVALMAYVRGVPVVAARPDAIRPLIARICDAPASIDAQSALDDVAALAGALVVEEGVAPGPFRVLYLPRLDVLEKFHHAMHGPFTGIRAMYCDIWVHSIVVYGALERTWGFGDVYVRPALKLPVMLFLLDRLGRGKTALGEYLGAPIEAVSGMDMHTLPGRARLWKRVLAAADRHPELAELVRVQLGLAEPGWIDPAEELLWGALAADPTRAKLSSIALGGEGVTSPPPRPEPARWAEAWRALSRSGLREPLGEGVGAAGEQRERR